MKASSTSIRHVLRAARGLLACAGLVLVAGCATLDYYAQAVAGHWQLTGGARDIAELQADPATRPALRERLARAAQMREFASDALALPRNASYTRYAASGRRYAVWSVTAAPELGLTPRTWCYPVVGCASYRGYFAEPDAQAAASALRDAGWDVRVAGVPAYSTLGWLADPLLDTFALGSETQLAALMFHELAHQQLYLPGDSGFNEAFATAVETEGVRRWLAAHGTPAQRSEWQAHLARRAQFLALLRAARGALARVYAAGGNAAQQRAGKAAVLAQLRADYAQLKAGWGGWTGYDRFFAEDLGNAHLASVATYHDLVPGFLALLEAAGGDLPRLYAAAAALAREPAAARAARLAGALLP